MNYKIISAAAIALTMLTGAAVAQTTNETTNTRGQMTFASPDEEALYTGRPFLSGFFTDDTMGTMRSDAEMRSAYSAMSADDRAMMKADCDKVQNNKGSYGTTTAGLCASVGQY